MQISIWLAWANHFKGKSRPALNATRLTKERGVVEYCKKVDWSVTSEKRPEKARDARVTTQHLRNPKAKESRRVESAAKAERSEIEVGS